jgi:uncharacterized protein YceK
MTQKSMARWLAMLALALLSGCGLLRQGQEGAEGPEVGSRSQPPVVVVTNHHWATVTISAIRGGRSVRLGNLNTNQTERFELPRVFGTGSESVQFAVDPIGATYNYVTELVFAGPGSEIVLTVHNNLNLSTVTLR